MNDKNIKEQDSCEMVINGAVIDLFNLKKKAHIISIENTVPALQNIIRFNGFSGYSVAEHSLFLACFLKAVKKETNNLDIFVKECLVHDFGESLTGDIIRPIKVLLPEIRTFEKRIDTQIREHYGLQGEEMSPTVDMLDKLMATIEAYYLTIFDGKTLIDLTDEHQIQLFNTPLKNPELQNLLTGQLTQNGYISFPELDKGLTTKFILQLISLANRCENLLYWKDWLGKRENRSFDELNAFEFIRYLNKNYKSKFYLFFLDLLDFNRHNPNFWLSQV